MKQRIAAVLALFIFVSAAITARLSLISTAEPLMLAAKRQSAVVLNIAQTRGRIYDRYLRPITDSETKNIAAIMPNEQAADAVMRAIPAESRANFREELTGMVPFLWEVNSDQIFARGLEVFEVTQRYSKNQPAVHLIGQIDSATGRGASGLEKAYDELLRSAGGTLQMRYTSDAMRRGSYLQLPEIIDTGYQNKAGIVLTLDLDIQLIAEQAAKRLERGAVVIMDPNNGDILACASVPAYDPNNAAKSLGGDGQPFFNRALAAYNVGSTFKLLTAAAALETGINTDRSYECEGFIEIKDQVFRCHNLAGHKTIDMVEAMNRSCNPYFISLALQLGGQTLLYKARQLGFGSALELAPGMFTASGTLPDESELTAPAAVANFGFGQGKLTATPIQIATLTSVFANGGGVVTPRLVMGSSSDGEKMYRSTTVYSQRKLFTEKAAETVKQLMISVVEDGSGKKAKPEHGSAGGKTASAQTGQYQNGVERVHAWFSGFYPANQPKYVITVLAEDGNSGSDAACPVFAEIANGIWQLEQQRRYSATK